MIDVREADAGDVASILDFNKAMARETEGVVLRPDTLESGIREVLGDPAKGFYLVAEKDGEIVGQTLVTFEWSDWRNGFFWWIQSVYVSPEARKQGVYRALGEAVESLANERDDVCGIRLYVIRHNAAARAVYERMGMTCTGYRLYEKEF